MCELFNYRPHTIVEKSGEIYLTGSGTVEKLPPLPLKRKVKNPIVLDGIPYIRGFELVNGKWKRTLKAMSIYSCMKSI